jgi:peptidoglycan/LPS O-acetylase OafA/YrhL
MPADTLSATPSGDGEETRPPVPTVRFPGRNNFDLIRLIAAAQVALVHGVEHLGIRLPAHEITLRVLECFPGVPIFFCVSGFLISASWQRSAGFRDFFTNRILRIFPALWLCFALSVALIAATGYFAKGVPHKDFAIWTVAQITFLQFFNPAFLRDWGDGVVNGSLWTIPVEMQFYLLTPLIVGLYLRWRAVFWIAVGVFVATNLIHTHVLASTADWDMLRKLAAVTFAPWVYMFMLGAAANMAWGRLRPVIEGRFAYWLSAYAVVVVSSLFIDLGATGNHIALPWAVILIGVTLSAAFTRPELAELCLRRNDISYGLYIFHMPIYNFAIEMGWLRNGWSWAVFASVFVVAALSWNFMERPALRLKRRSIGAPVTASLGEGPR